MSPRASASTARARPPPSDPLRAPRARARDAPRRARPPRTPRSPPVSTPPSSYRRRFPGLCLAATRELVAHRLAGAKQPTRDRVVGDPEPLRDLAIAQALQVVQLEREPEVFVDPCERRADLVDRDIGPGRRLVRCGLCRIVDRLERDGLAPDPIDERVPQDRREPRPHLGLRRPPGLEVLQRALERVLHEVVGLPRLTAQVPRGRAQHRLVYGQILAHPPHPRQRMLTRPRMRGQVGERERADGHSGPPTRRRAPRIFRRIFTALEDRAALVRGATAAAAGPVGAHAAIDGRATAITDDAAVGADPRAGQRRAHGAADAWATTTAAAHLARRAAAARGGGAGGA